MCSMPLVTSVCGHYVVCVNCDHPEGIVPEEEEEA